MLDIVVGEKNVRGNLGADWAVNVYVRIKVFVIIYFHLPIVFNMYYVKYDEIILFSSVCVFTLLLVTRNFRVSDVDFITLFFLQHIKSLETVVKN